MPPHKKVVSIAIVGPGRVGRALGRLLRQRGWRIGAVVTRSRATARAAAHAIGAGTPHVLDVSQRRIEKQRTRLVARVAAASSAAETRGRSSNRRAHDIESVGAILDADVILIATPDAAIAGVARDLARLGAHLVAQGARDVPRRGALRLSPWRGKVVLHTCGALDRGVLRPLERRGAATGSIHPLQTFGKNSIAKLKGVACAIEGSPAALRTAQRICRDLGCLSIRIPRGAKPAYHAAAVFVAGHILGVIEAATRIIMASGFSRRQAVQALLPLTRQTLANFERKGAVASWTGPAARGDLATIRMHEAALRRFAPEYRAAYAALTKLSVLLLRA